ncbi:MAG TPA: hypothetical protein VFX60_19220 [Micromonospora sp.]|nr:hypothetical protein [Micromonospora sp.]
MPNATPPKRVTHKSEEVRRKLATMLRLAEKGTHVGVKRYDELIAVFVPLDWYEQASALMDREHGQ